MGYSKCYRRRKEIYETDKRSIKRSLLLVESAVCLYIQKFVMATTKKLCRNLNNPEKNMLWKEQETGAKADIVKNKN